MVPSHTAPLVWLRLYQTPTVCRVMYHPDALGMGAGDIDTGLRGEGQCDLPDHIAPLIVQTDSTCQTRASDYSLTEWFLVGEPKWYGMVWYGAVVENILFLELLSTPTPSSNGKSNWNWATPSKTKPIPLHERSGMCCTKRCRIAANPCQL